MGTRPAQWVPEAREAHGFPAWDAPESDDPPFVGRSEERKALAEFLAPRTVSGAGPASAADSACRVVHVVGEEGIGKTRLIREALDILRGASPPDARPRVVWLDAPPAGLPIPYYPIVEWARSEWEAGPDLSATDLRQRIRQGLENAGAADVAGDAALLELLFGISEATGGFREMAPGQLEANLFALLRRLVLGRGHEARRGVVVVADDCHRFDPQTLRFLRRLIEWPGDADEAPHTALALAYESGEVPPIPSARGQLTLFLKPLDGAERRLLLERLLPADEFLPEIRRAIVEGAPGLPAFLDELSRIVREIARANGGDLNGEAARNQVIEVIPTSLRDLVRARIARLDTRERQAIQALCLLGMEFSICLVDLLGRFREALGDHLQALCALHLLERRGAGDRARIRFRNSIVLESTYASLSESERTRLHLDLALGLESAFRERLPEHYETLAFHFGRGGDTERSAYYQVKSADRLETLGATEKALERYSEAIRRLEDLEPSGQNLSRMARALIRGGRIHRTLGHGEEAAEMFAAARECALALGELSPRQGLSGGGGSSAAVRSAWLRLQVQLEQAITRVWEGDAAASEAVAGPGIVGGSSGAADTLAGSPLDQLEAIAREAEALGCATVEQVAHNAVGMAHWQRGDYEPALAAFQAVAKIASPVSMPAAVADAYNNAGMIYWRWGEIPQAMRAFKKALPLRQRAADSMGRCATLLNIGILYENQGRIESARKTYAKALKLAEATGYVQALAALESNLSNLERRVGSPARAAAHAIRAIHFSQLASDPVLECIGEENAGLALLAMMDRGIAGEERAKRDRPVPVPAPPSVSPSVSPSPPAPDFSSVSLCLCGEISPAPDSPTPTPSSSYSVFCMDHFRRALYLADTSHNVEREISARLGLLELARSTDFAGPDSAPEAGTGAKADPLSDGAASPREALVAVDDLIHRAERLRIQDLVCRGCLIKAWLVESMEGSGAAERGVGGAESETEPERETGREREVDSHSPARILETARDVAKNAGNVLDELDALEALVSWARRHADETGCRAWEENLTALRATISMSDSRGEE